MRNKFYVQLIMKEEKDYLSNTSWLILERVTRLSLVLVVGVFLARYLGPEKYGVLSYCISFVGMFSAIASLGLDGIVVEKLVNARNNYKNLLGTVLVLKFLGALSVFLITIFASFIFNNSTFESFLIIIIATALIFDSICVIDLYFQANVQGQYIAKAKITQIAISTLLKFLMIYSNAELYMFALLILVDSFILAVCYLYVFQFQAKKQLSFDFSVVLAKKLLFASKALIFADVIISIHTRIDLVMLKYMLGLREVGIYRAATTLNEAWYFLPMVISASIFPLLVSAKKKDESEYLDNLQKLFNLMVWMALAITIPVILFADEICFFLYGAEYLGASDVMRIQIMSCVFVFLGVASGKQFLIEKTYSFVFQRVLLGVSVNILLNLYLIPKYNINGAAFSTVISHFVSSFLFDVMQPKTRVLFFMKIKSLLFIDKRMFSRKLR